MSLILKRMSKFNSDFENLKVEKVKNLLIEYSDLFCQKDGDIGLVKGIVHEIDTKNSPPVCHDPRRPPIHLEEKVDLKIEKMLKENIIRRSKSPWNAPLVI